jgi:predicted NUDIX family NTP pyrophosphohydrolase
VKKFSAGILVYRKVDGKVEVLIAHPGGPFFTKKDEGFWSLPKGLVDENEEAFAAAKREFEEEIGQPTPESEYINLGQIKRSDGKIIAAWAVEGEVDTYKVKSNTFEIEWPPKSSKRQQFPEIDKAEWFSLENAVPKLQLAQVVFLERLAEALNIEFHSNEAAEQNQQQLL